MEEKEALLYRDLSSQKNRQKSRQIVQNGNESDNTSSDDSDDWYEESQSICSSCCDLHSASSFEWEKEINEKGELFYVESDPAETNYSSAPSPNEKLENGTTQEKTDKSDNIKKGKLLNWVRRKESKRLHQNKVPQQLGSFQSSPDKNSDLVSNSKQEEKEFKLLVIKVDSVVEGETLSEQLLGLSLGFTKENSIMVTNLIPERPAVFSNEISPGDIIHKINDYAVNSQNIDSILQSLNIPCEVFLKVEKTENPSTLNRSKYQSSFVQSLLKRNKDLDSYLLDQPVGVVLVDVESQNLDKDDVIYCYPEKCVLSSCRGAFVTLYHLLADIRPNDVCQSSSVVLNNEPTHIMYSSYENFLLLVAIPKSRFSLSEATFLMSDLIRHISFSHQNVKKCFESADRSSLDHFFSLFFYRILFNGFSDEPIPFFSRSKTIQNLEEDRFSKFEEIMPYASWVPLPKEAQTQIDEALNELEANELDNEEEDCIENQRIFNIIGSALFHKGYLLASHLPKEDLLDVYSFYRQTNLIQLMRNEPVKSLIVWREVYPSSVNRGLPMTKLSNFIVPSGRWFLLTVGQGNDLLCVILEAGECCAKMDENPGPSVPYVEEAEDTLRHMQKLGISTLASQWIESNSRFRTVTPEEIFSKLADRRKDNLLGFVKTLDGNTKHLVPAKASPTGSKSGDVSRVKKSSRNTGQETSEDSVSQTASNISEVSDENAPILGRRAERGKGSSENLSGDSDSSDSDWDSSRDSNMRESICSSAIENFYLCDVGEILPSRLTTGPEDILFYYVHLDGNEGVLVNPPLNAKRQTVKMKEILENFRRCSQIIHSILENSVKFKNNCQDNSKCLMNKSLVAVKEHGVLFECSSESDNGKKPLSFTYWIVGRLFFAPQPREIYVCYHDEAPQNLVELAFRLCLSSAG